MGIKDGGLVGVEVLDEVGGSVGTLGLQVLVVFHVLELGVHLYNCSDELGFVDLCRPTALV